MAVRPSVVMRSLHVLRLGDDGLLGVLVFFPVLFFGVDDVEAQLDDLAFQEFLVVVHGKQTELGHVLVLSIQALRQLLLDQRIVFDELGKQLIR